MNPESETGFPKVKLQGKLRFMYCVTIDQLLVKCIVCWFVALLSEKHQQSN